MSQWPSAKAKRVFAALFSIGWEINNPGMTVKPIMVRQAHHERLNLKLLVLSRQPAR